MAERRTTVIAREEDLAVVAHEARARGVSLGRMLGEVVAQRAQELRQTRQPRLATFRANVSIAQAAADSSQPAARPFRGA